MAFIPAVLAGSAAMRELISLKISVGVDAMVVTPLQMICPSAGDRPTDSQSTECGEATAAPLAIARVGLSSGGYTRSMVTWMWVVWLVAGLLLVGMEVHTQAFYALFLALGSFAATIVAVFPTQVWLQA